MLRSKLDELAKVLCEIELQATDASDTIRLRMENEEPKPQDGSQGELSRQVDYMLDTAMSILQNVSLIRDELTGGKKNHDPIEAGTFVSSNR